MMKINKPINSGKAIGKAFFPTIGSSRSRKPPTKFSITACPFPGINFGVPTENRITAMRRIEIAHVVSIEFVTGKPKIFVNSYGDGLTAPSAANRDVTVPEKKKKVSNSLFTKNFK